MLLFAKEGGDIYSVSRMGATGEARSCWTSSSEAVKLASSFSGPREGVMSELTFRERRERRGVGLEGGERILVVVGEEGVGHLIK